MNVPDLLFAYVQGHDLDQSVPARCHRLGAVGLEQARAALQLRHDKHADLFLAASDRFLAERLERLVIEQRGCRMADEQGMVDVLGERFQTRGDVDGVANDRKFEMPVRAEIVDHNYSGMETDPHIQGTPWSDLGENFLRRLDRMVGVVLGDPGGTEDRHHAVTHERIDPAVVAIDDRRHAALEAIQEVEQFARLQFLCVLRETAGIGE